MDNNDNNKLIAEFMGLELEDTLKGFSVYARRNETNTTDFFELHELKYHSSWDWLMPVVTKIEQIPYSVHISAYQRCTRHSCYISGPAVLSEANTKIAAVYEAVVKLIKWLNEQK